MTKTFKEVNDVYMFGKNDEARQKSEKFLEFWCKFIDDVVKNMPKVEKKKTKPKTTAPMSKKKGGGMMNDDMLAEMKAIQAKKAAEASRIKV